MRAPYKKLLVSATPFLIIIVGILWFVGSEASKAESLVFAEPRSIVDGVRVTSGDEARIGIQGEQKLPNATKNLSGLVLSSLAESAEQGNGAPLENLDIDLEGLLEIAEPIEKKKPYKLSELVVIQDPDQDALNRYAKEFLQSIVGNFYEGLGEEANIVYSTFGGTGEAAKQDAEAKLGGAADTYAKIAQSLIETPVPLQLASRHLEMANAYLELSYATKLFQFGVRDPLLVMKALRPYFNALDTIAAVSQTQQ